MEPFSVAAAAITLGPIVIQIGRSLREVANSVKYARRELLELTNEMAMFTDLYDSFLDVCFQDSRKRKRVSSAGERLVSWTEKAIDDFKDLLLKVDAIAKDPKLRHTVSETFTAHVNWYFSKNHVERLRASLSLARQSMVGFTNVHAIKLLNKQLSFLRSIRTVAEREKIEREFGMTVKQRIQQLQDKIHSRHIKQKDVDQCLQEATTKVASQQEQSGNNQSTRQDKLLLQLSKSVERYIDRVLPAQKPEKRLSSSRRKINTSSKQPQDIPGTSSQSTVTSFMRSIPSSISPITAAPESPPTSPEPPDEDSLDEVPPTDKRYVSMSSCGQPEAYTFPILDTASEASFPVHPCQHPSMPTYQERLHTMNLRNGSPNGPTPSTRETSHQSTSEPASEIITDHPQETTGSAEMIHDDEKESEREEVVDEPTSEDEAYEHEKEEQKLGPSIFQPAAGTPGYRPRHWDKRHKRSESPQDFWLQKPWEK